MRELILSPRHYQKMVDLGVDPADTIYFDRGLTWPPDAEAVHRTAVEEALVRGTATVCVAVDAERGVVTYSNVRLCDKAWPLQECERMEDSLRDTIARHGTAEDLAVYDAIIAESVALTKHLLTAERPSFEPPSKPAGYDANGSPVEDP